MALVPIMFGKRSVSLWAQLYNSKAVIGSHVPVRCLATSVVTLLHRKNQTKDRADFNSPQVATAVKSNFELLRGWLVFNIFNSDDLVDNSMKYYELSKKVLGPKVTERGLRATVFGQFVGGLDERECRRTVRQLADAGVSSIWNYSVEKDLESEEDIETEAAMFEKEKEFTEVNNRYLKSIKMSASYNGDPSLKLAAVKLTAIANPHMLKRVNEMLVLSWSVFDQLASPGETVTDRVIAIDTLRKELPLVLDQGIQSNERGVNIVQWNKHFSVARNLDRFQQLCEKANVNPEVVFLSSLEWQQLESFIDKLDSIGKCADEYGVRVLMDAEQTYFQKLFDHLVMHHLMPQYNKERVVLYNTVQGYLKNAMDNALEFLATTTEYGVHCGIKLVRGAYMVQERAVAQSKDCKDPIQPSQEATNTSYNTCLSHLLHTVPQGRLCVIVASHNQESIELALKTMDKLNISKTDGTVGFGQLLGMGDYLTYPLASAGYLSNKVVPYGTLDDVVPFLARRAQENRSLMVNADKEREIYSEELKRRFSNLGTKS